MITAFASAIAGVIVYNNRGNDRYDRYLSSVDVSEIIRLRKDAEDAFKTRNFFLAGLAAVWLAHLLDLKFSSRSGVKGDVAPERLQMSFYYSF